MVLVDTSSWIETLREGGDTGVRERVTSLVLEGEAAWCDMIRLELWHGVRGGREKDLVELEQVVVTLPVDEAVWDNAITLAKVSRSRGLTVQSPDLVIVATAQRHGVRIDSMDAHIERLVKMA